MAVLCFIGDLGILFIYFILLIYYYYFYRFKAAPTADGSFQARGRIGVAAAGLSHSHSNVGSEPASAVYTTAYGNARSLTH